MLKSTCIVVGAITIAFLVRTAAAETFDLTVPGTTTRSNAELTASSLTINHQGQANVYSRETLYDVPGYLGFTSQTLGQIILWPSKGTGSMQIAKIPRVGAPKFGLSQMKITRVAAPVGTVPVPTRGGLVDTTRSYRLTNEFLGKTRSLAADTKGATVMDRSNEVVEQAWTFVAAGKETYRLTNVAWGNGYSLTAQGRDSQPAMERTNLRSRAQLWRLTKDGSAIRLTNEALGARWSLDTVSTGSNEPFLLASGNYGGQFWAVTEFPTIVGTWQEYEERTNTPKGITVDIRVDLIRKELSFRQTEPGESDLVGTVQLVGDRLTLIHSSRRVEEFLVTLKADRIGFTDMGRRPTGFVWRRIGSGPALTMKLTSTAFENSAPIPAKYCGPGDDVSPPLAWSDAPVGTKSFALICDDPDAPSRARPRPEGPWVHWVAYNIPANARELLAAVPRRAELAQPAGTRQGMNDFGSDNVGYRGPMPPKGSGPHRYFFKIYALDQQLNLAARDATKKSLLAAMKGHVLAEGKLMGTFDALSPQPQSRLVSRNVVPNPPLRPVTVKLTNSHKNGLWVLIANLNNDTSRKVKISARGSKDVTFERDSGSKVVEIYEVTKANGDIVREEQVTEVPPKALYDISVYELFAQSTYIDRTQPNSKPEVTYAPKSLGFFVVPAKMAGGKSDIYKAAKKRNNPGQVRRINPKDWDGDDLDDEPDAFGSPALPRRRR